MKEEKKDCGRMSSISTDDDLTANRPSKVEHDPHTAGKMSELADTASLQRINGPNSAGKPFFEVRSHSSMIYDGVVLFPEVSLEESRQEEARLIAVTSALTSANAYPRQEEGMFQCIVACHHSLATMQITCFFCSEPKWFSISTRYCYR